LVRLRARQLAVTPWQCVTGAAFGLLCIISLP
jgi:hypothetical protein